MQQNIMNQQNQHFMMQQQQQQQQMLAPSSAPVASFPNLPNQVPNLAAATAASLAQTQAPNAAAAQQLLFQQPQQGNAAKRRRVDETTAAPVLSGEQLVAAAAQAMQSQGGRARKKSQAQIDRRRERNRILARRTRLRKKFFFESLQKDVLDLQRENTRLKDIVRNNVEQNTADNILAECDALERMPESVLEACGETANDMDKQDFNLVSSIQKSQHAFIITDPSLQDNPIVFASGDFLKLTGYSREDVLGRNCRFLQGTDTHPDKVEKIRKGMATGEDVSVTMLNYKQDGTPFWNKLFIAALRDAQNNIVNYIGVTVEVATPEPGDPEHGKLLAADVDGEEDSPEAEDTVKAIEGVVSAAVAASGGVN